MNNQIIQLIKLGFVNSYLIKQNDNFFLIDTGYPDKRVILEEKINKKGCTKDNLKLIILTHGDFDHSGNCAYLREKYKTKIAMHHYDVEMVENGSMKANRKDKPDKYSLFFKIISNLSKEVKIEKFKPDILLQDNDELFEYGLNAKIIHIPGHSKGSIGILTENKDFFCGDLIKNFFKPKLHFLIDDIKMANASIEKLKGLEIKKIYPGHGKPFSIESF